MVRYPYIFNVRILRFWRYPLSGQPSSNNFTASLCQKGGAAVQSRTMAPDGKEGFRKVIS